MNAQELQTRRKAATLELEAYDKLAEAHRLLTACGCEEGCEGSMQVMAPAIAPATTVSPEATLLPAAAQTPPTITLVMSGKEKLASLEILNKVASELFASKDPEIKKLAGEVDKIASDIDKTAHVYEADTVDPELEMHSSFRGGVDKHDKDEDFMNAFKTDIHHEVAKAVKDGRVYQPIKK